MNLQRVLGHLKTPIVREAIILLYHRISQAQNDPWSLCVSPQHFSEHLEVLRAGSSPMTLRGLTRAVQARQRLARSVVITFDDGYADNLHQAKPLLERYDIPATVFVITGAVGREREFWWDELERLIFGPETLPDCLSLLVGSTLFNWRWSRPMPLSSRIGRAFSGKISSRVAGNRGDSPAVYNAGPANRDPARESLYRALWNACSNLRETERCHVLDELQAWSAAAPGSRQTHCPLSIEELLELGEGELVEIGSHTVTHPFLSRLPVIMQVDELRRSRDRLEEIIGPGVTSVSYPHGDYSRKTAALAVQAGYARACSTAARTVRGSSDPFQLPRMMVEDWDGEEFGRRLSAWLQN